MVSVIIPFFNRKEYLGQTLLSLRNEAIEKEIILVDDASRDNWQDIVELCPEEQLVTLPVNRGPGAARNRGVALAKGEYIYFLDSDDLLVPKALQKLLEYLNKHPLEMAVGGRIASVIDADGRRVTSKSAHSYCTPPMLDRLTIEFLHQNGTFSGGLWLFLFRRSLISKVSPMDEAHWGSEDRDYLLSILRMTTIPMIDVPIVHRRIHESNLVMEKDWTGEFCLKQKQVAQNLLNLLASRHEAKI
jgi:glycosyltransferase involved in cell wall biosynthesis